MSASTVTLMSCFTSGSGWNVVNSRYARLWQYSYINYSNFYYISVRVIAVIWPWKRIEYSIPLISPGNESAPMLCTVYAEEWTVGRIVLAASQLWAAHLRWSSRYPQGCRWPTRFSVLNMSILMQEFIFDFGFFCVTLHIIYSCINGRFSCIT